MKVFPVDSIVTKLGDDGLPIYDRPYVSADLRDVYANFFSNGVFMDVGTSLQVMNASGGMNVYVNAGTCHINGAFGVETEQRTLQLEAASASLDRIDTIVARLNLAIEARSLDLYVLKGTPAEDPVRPNLTRNETVWELGLADVYLPKGIATISQGRISDTRLETQRCGAVTPFVEFDTTTLFEQLKQATQDAVDAMNDALDGTTAGNLERYRRSLRVETEIPASADLNTYQTAGNLGCSVSGNVAGIENKPSGLSNPFLLFVHTAGSAVLQEVIDAVDGSRWCRAGTGAWVQTYDSSSIVPVADGGTGMTSNPSMLTNLSSTSAASVFQASPRPGVTGTLPVANGGTGATTVDAARSNLGLNGQTGYLKAGRDTLSNLSRNTLYNLAPGTCLVNSSATNGPESGSYGNLLVSYSGGNRIVGLLAYDNGHVYTTYGASGSDTFNWVRVSNGVDVGELLWSGTCGFGGTIGNVAWKIKKYSIVLVQTGWTNTANALCSVVNASDGLHVVGGSRMMRQNVNNGVDIAVNLVQNSGNDSMTCYATAQEWDNGQIGGVSNQNVTIIWGVC